MPSRTDVYSFYSLVEIHSHHLMFHLELIDYMEPVGCHFLVCNKLTGMFIVLLHFPFSSCSLCIIFIILIDHANRNIKQHFSPLWTISYCLMGHLRLSWSQVVRLLASSALSHNLWMTLAGSIPFSCSANHRGNEVSHGSYWIQWSFHVIHWHVRSSRAQYALCSCSSFWLIDEGLCSPVFGAPTFSFSAAGAEAVEGIREWNGNTPITQKSLIVYGVSNTPFTLRL